MLVGPGVEAFVLFVGVEGPVLREVTVADENPEGQDGFGAGDAPPTAGDIETVGHQTRLERVTGYCSAGAVPRGLAAR